jgi:hypothetical protein
MTQAIPQDLIQKPDGSFVSLSQQPPRKLKAHELVTKLFPRSLTQSDELALLKKVALQGMNDHRAEMFNDYEVDVTGKEGGFSLKSICGTMRLELSINKHVTLGEELQIVKTKIDEFLKGELEGSSEAIREIVTSAFKLNAKGTLSTERVLGLRKHGFDHPIWLEAMVALEDTISRDSSTTYVRFYNVDPKTKAETMVPLSMAAV